MMQCWVIEVTSSDLSMFPLKLFSMTNEIQNAVYSSDFYCKNENDDYFYDVDVHDKYCVIFRNIYFL